MAAQGPRIYGRASVAAPQPSLGPLAVVARRQQYRAIERLPEEVILLICRLLVPTIPQAKIDIARGTHNLKAPLDADPEWAEFFANHEALLNLGLTSKYFHDLVRPLLYERILFSRLESVVQFRLIANHRRNRIRTQSPLAFVREVSFLGAIDVCNDRQLVLQALEAVTRRLHPDDVFTDPQWPDFRGICRSCDQAFPFGRIIGVQGVVLDLVSRMHKLERLQLCPPRGTFIRDYFMFSNVMWNCPINLQRPGTPAPIWPPPRLAKAELVFPLRDKTIVRLDITDSVRGQQLLNLRRELVEGNFIKVLQQPDGFDADNMNASSLFDFYSFVEKLANNRIVREAGREGYVASLKRLATPGKHIFDKLGHQSFMSWFLDQVSRAMSQDLNRRAFVVDYDIIHFCSGALQDKEWRQGSNPEMRSAIDIFRLKYIAPGSGNTAQIYRLRDAIWNLPGTLNTLDLRLNLPSALAKEVYGGVNGRFADLYVVGARLPQLHSFTLTMQALFGTIGYFKSMVDVENLAFARLPPGAPGEAIQTPFGLICSQIPGTVKELRIIDYFSSDHHGHCSLCEMDPPDLVDNLMPLPTSDFPYTFRTFMALLRRHGRGLKNLETVVFETLDDRTYPSEPCVLPDEYWRGSDREAGETGPIYPQVRFERARSWV
jgi:hypothetical protein